MHCATKHTWRAAQVGHCQAERCKSQCPLVQKLCPELDHGRQQGYHEEARGKTRQINAVESSQSCDEGAGKARLEQGGQGDESSGRN